MDANRKIDQEVAEKIFGWKDFEIGKKDSYFAGKLLGQPPEPNILTPPQLWLVPNYTSDMKEAWTIVMKLQEQGFGYAIFHDHEDVAVAQFYNRDGINVKYSEYTCDMHLAICKAALEVAKSLEEK